MSMFTEKQKVQKTFQRQQNTRSSEGLTDELTLDQQKKRKFYIKETIYTLYYISRIALTVLILIVLNQNFVTKITQTSQYSRMQQNIALWKQGTFFILNCKDVIVNITTVNSYNCPQGFQTYTSYDWPGTKQGCYCYASLGEWDYIKILQVPFYIKQGACNDMAIGAGCKTINKVNAIPFLFWKKDELICIKRVKNLDFFTSLNDQNIPAIECAQGKDFQIGIPQNLNLSSCPITDIDKDKTSLKQQILQIQFSYDRESSYPIAAIKMTEYEFCPDFQRPNISPQRGTNYNLQNQFREFCEGIDPRMVQIEQIGEDQLFRNNPRIMDVVQQLPAYPLPMSDYRYKLGFVRYPEWKYSCRKSSQFSLIETEKHLTLEDILETTNMCISLGSIFVIIAGVFLTIVFIFRKIYELYYRVQQKVLYDTLPQIQKKKPNLYQKLHKKFVTELIIFIGSILVSLGLIITMAILHQELQANFQWYKQSRICTSQIMKELTEQGYVGYLDQEQRNVLLCIILVLVLVIIDTIMFLWRNIKGDLKKQDFTQQMTNIFDDDIPKQENHKVDVFNIPVHDKEIDLENMSNHTSNNINNNHGYISENISHQSHVNITQESLMSVEYIHPTTIVRPKRQKRSKALEPSEMSDGTQEWEI